MKKPQSDNLTVAAAFKQADCIGKAALIFSIWFGAGLFPFAPGTFGTLAAFPLVLALENLGPTYRFIILATVIVLGITASTKAQNVLGRDDPPEIVIDEVAGFLLALIFLPYSWVTVGLGFILFRLFDILKPFPIRSLEKIKGGTGIMADDLAAGVYTFACVKGLLFLMGMKAI